MRVGKKKIECPICNDVGAVFDKATNSAALCGCLAVKRQRRIIEKSGITEAFRKKTIENYESRNDVCAAMKRMSLEYLKDVSAGEFKSIGFFGQSGSGKTHLSIAIANELMDMGIATLYMPYVEKITELKNLNRMQNSKWSDDDDACYEKAVDELKDIKVLMIDDLFKRAEDSFKHVNGIDIRIMFDIINTRCLKGLPIIISSEYTLAEIVKVDEALGGRIAEMCENYCYILPNSQGLNYRLRNF